MIRGLYTSASGMITQKKKLDVVTNNLANAATNGFKEDRLVSSSFEEMYISRLNDSGIVNKTRGIGTNGFGVHIDEIITSFEPGNLEETGIYTDIALLGDGFFVIDTPEGQRYTKSGAFKISPEGFLVTHQGYPVQGRDGAIPVGNGDFEVDSQGNITTQNGVFTFQITAFDNPGGLRKQGDNLYFIQDANMIEPENTVIKQGFIESSNVDLVKQMIEMIEIQRSFEINQRMVKIQDERLGKAVNEIGRI